MTSYLPSANTSPLSMNWRTPVSRDYGFTKQIRIYMLVGFRAMVKIARINPATIIKSE